MSHLPSRTPSAPYSAVQPPTFHAREDRDPISTAAHRPESGTPPLLDRLLQRTSRTFALTIPFLAEPLRREVTVAYLLFRVADTLEDATHLDREAKLEELARFQRLLAHASADEAAALAARWRARPPVEHQGYLELLDELPALVAAALQLEPQAWRHVAQHTARTTGRMAAFVGRAEHAGVALRDLADLRDYCYAVAGIVGEMLTELFLLAEPRLLVEATALRQDAASFGEALQLVNILKDSADDLQEGRLFLPAGVQRGSIFALAHDDLDTAARYCATLEAAGASAGILGFSALPVLLARATLDVVEREGPGGKVTRDEVARILGRLQAALARGEVRELLALPRSPV